MSKSLFLGLSATVLAALSIPSHALDLQPDGINVSYGQYLDLVSGRSADYTNLRLGLIWDWQPDLYQSDNVHVSSFLELAVSSWKSNLDAKDNPSPDGKGKATVVSFSPVFRISFLPSENFHPFVDLGVGAAYLSEKDLEKEKKSPINMGGNWQFEVRAKLGVEFGEQRQFDINYGWFHYSNAGIHSMNESIDFQAVTLGWHW